MGLRFDEPARVSRVRAREPGEWDVACPLYDARVTGADVLAFWRAQPFDLALRPHESNCDGCYLKSAAILERIERDHPGTLDWWDAQEKRIGATFKPNLPRAKIIARARLPMLPLALDTDAAVESFRRTEPANGNGEIHYFQGDKTVIADPEKLLDAVDQAVEEGRRLAAKLGQTESPKDQFFIKQELINWQEGLRALFLRVIKMCERNAWTLPRYTAGVLDAPVLRRLLERLSMENWSNLEEFGAFAAAAEELRRAFRARTEPRLAYLLDLRRELEEN